MENNKPNNLPVLVPVSVNDELPIDLKNENNVSNAVFFTDKTGMSHIGGYNKNTNQWLCFELNKKYVNGEVSHWYKEQQQPILNQDADDLALNYLTDLFGTDFSKVQLDILTERIKQLTTPNNFFEAELIKKGNTIIGLKTHKAELVEALKIAKSLIKRYAGNAGVDLRNVIEFELINRRIQRHEQPQTTNQKTHGI